jgi:hypothetical protein
MNTGMVYVGLGDGNRRKGRGNRTQLNSSTDWQGEVDWIGIGNGKYLPYMYML